ncbi:hypothetical protein GQR58_011682 [Nymphon striatum]|nr:hypothetical protein GQR58_011682 [Nymphon striatum]
MSALQDLGSEWTLKPELLVKSVCVIFAMQESIEVIAIEHDEWSEELEAMHSKGEELQQKMPAYRSVVVGSVYNADIVCRLAVCPLNLKRGKKAKEESFDDISKHSTRKCLSKVSSSQVQMATNPIRSHDIDDKHRNQLNVLENSRSFVAVQTYSASEGNLTNILWDIGLESWPKSSRYHTIHVHQAKKYIILSHRSQPFVECNIDTNCFDCYSIVCLTQIPTTEFYNGIVSLKFLINHKIHALFTNENLVTTFTSSIASSLGIFPANCCRHEAATATGPKTSLNHSIGSNDGRTVPLVHSLMYVTHSHPIPAGFPQSFSVLFLNNIVIGILPCMYFPETNKLFLILLTPVSVIELNIDLAAFVIIDSGDSKRDAAEYDRPHVSAPRALGHRRNVLGSISHLTREFLLSMAMLTDCVGNSGSGFIRLYFDSISNVFRTFSPLGPKISTQTGTIHVHKLYYNQFYLLYSKKSNHLDMLLKPNMLLKVVEGAMLRIRFFRHHFRIRFKMSHLLCMASQMWVYLPVYRSVGRFKGEHSVLGAVRSFLNKSQWYFTLPELEGAVVNFINTMIGRNCIQTERNMSSLLIPDNSIFDFNSMLNSDIQISDLNFNHFQRLIDARLVSIINYGANIWGHKRRTHSESCSDEFAPSWSQLSIAADVKFLESK